MRFVRTLKTAVASSPVVHTLPVDSRFVRALETVVVSKSVAVAGTAAVGADMTLEEEGVHHDLRIVHTPEQPVAVVQSKHCFVVAVACRPAAHMLAATGSPYCEKR